MVSPRANSAAGATSAAAPPTMACVTGPRRNAARAPRPEISAEAPSSTAPDPRLARRFSSVGNESATTVVEGAPEDSVSVTTRGAPPETVV